MNLRDSDDHPQKDAIRAEMERHMQRGHTESIAHTSFASQVAWHEGFTTSHASRDHAFVAPGCSDTQPCVSVVLIGHMYLQSTLQLYTKL